MFLTAILRQKQATRFFTIALCFLQTLKIRNGTHTNDIRTKDALKTDGTEEPLQTTDESKEEKNDPFISNL